MDQRRVLIALGIALPLAAVVAFLVYRQLYRASHAPGRVAHVNIVVAAVPLSLGTRLDTHALRLIDWPAAKPMPGMFVGAEECVGRVLLNHLSENEPVLESDLAPKDSGAGLPAVIPDGMRAVSVAVNDVIGVAGFVQPGTTVDVLATGAAEGQSAATVTRTILENIRVLAAGQKVEADKQNAPQTVTVVTLVVQPDQANILALASSQGRIQLALRNYGDAKTLNPPLAQQARVFAGATPDRVTVNRPVAPRPSPAPSEPAGYRVEVIRGGAVQVASVPPR